MKMLRHIFFITLSVTFVLGGPTNRNKDEPIETELNIKNEVMITSTPESTITDKEVDDIPEATTEEVTQESVLDEFIHEKDVKLKLNVADNSKSTVEIIELDPELVSDGEIDDELMNGAIELVKISEDGEEFIQDIPIRNLIEEVEKTVEDEEEELEDNDEVREVDINIDVDITDEEDDESSVEEEEDDDEEEIPLYLQDPLPSKPMNRNREIIVSKDNIFQILKAVILASTHKESPNYQDIIKAGALSAFKSSMSYIGKEKLGNNIIQLMKQYTGILNDDEPENEQEEELAALAEDYIKDHKFKVVLPESVLLHQPEMEEFISKKKKDGSLKPEDETQYTFSMPRQAAGVTTVMSKFYVCTSYLN